MTTVQDAVSRLREMDILWDGDVEFDPNKVIYRRHAAVYIAIVRARLRDSLMESVPWQKLDLSFLIEDLEPSRPRGDFTHYRDVPFHGEYYDAIYMLTQIGIVKGYPDNKFGDGQPVTREEFVTMVARLLKKMQLERDFDYRGSVFFNDVNDRRYSLGPIIALAAAGIIEGAPGRRMFPHRPLKAI